MGAKDTLLFWLKEAAAKCKFAAIPRYHKAAYKVRKPQ